MSDDRNVRLEEQWKRWARRPPATPADVAARRLMARLEEERRRPGVPPRRWGALAAAGAALLAVALVVALTVREPVAPAATVFERPPLKEGVVLIWLDTETPLYLTLRP